MSPLYGASPDTWLHWDLLGLGSDLLPVVCQPGLTISPTSKLTAYGKVPSRFDAHGHVVGFPRWTQYHASDEDLAAWSSDPRLGICLQTRIVRALDVDIEDFDAAQTVREALDSWTRGKGLPPFPIRYRKNSSKWLALFCLEGEYAKQVLHTEHGAIELLMGGQQCVIAGRHPSGADYEWEGGLDSVVGIPTVSEKLFEYLKNMLQYEICDMKVDWTEGRVRKAREAGQTSAVDDPVVQFLIDKHLAVNVTPERVDVICPWKDQHTTGSDPSSTSYFPAGTGGFECGHFRDLHSHCAHRSTADFLDAIGYTREGFEDISGTPSRDPNITEMFASVDDFVGQVRGTPVPNPTAEPRFIRNPSTGAIKVLVKNVVEALLHPEWCKMFVRYDTFRHTIMVGPPHACRKIDEIDSTRLNILLAEKTFGPGAVSDDMIKRAIAFVAHEREFDSAIEWLRALPPWDGHPRVERFCHHYLGAEDTPYHAAVSRYWWSAHAGRVLVPDGVQADAAIILVSQQGTGKTTTIKNIAPKKEHYGTISLTGEHYNRIREMRGRLAVELPELQGLKSRDSESIKAIISATGDVLVDKFEKYAQDLIRRCVFIGSSNDDGFLSDPTGNRRFLPVYVGEQQQLPLILRDRDQLWAEGKALFERLGEVDWREAQRLVVAEHCKFEEIDVWEERVFQWLDDPTNWCAATLDIQYMTIGKALHEALHMDTQKQAARDMHRIARIFVRYGLVKRNWRVAGHQTKIWVRKEINRMDDATLLL